MAKKYWLKFGSGDPASSSGLAPTFIHFIKFDGTTLAPPGLTQPITGVGLYQFTYTPSFSIGFTIDGATTGLSASNRYIFGNLDPNDRLDEIVLEVGSTLVAVGNTLVAQGSTVSGIAATLIAQGSTIVAIGNTLAVVGASTSALAAVIGTTASVIGDSATSPGDLFGYLKRVREFLEGSQTYVKSTQAWSIYDRSGATLLQSKTMTNNSTQVIRS